MPLGIRQNNNFLHLTMDVWQDQIFFNETVYPASHFATELLNVPDETIRELVTHGGAISHQVEALALAGRGEFIKLLDGTRASLEKLLDALWHCPPYSLMDKGQEQHTLEVMFSPASHNDLLKPASPAREFFFRYLVAAFSIPLGIQHFTINVNLGYDFVTDMLVLEFALDRQQIDTNPTRNSWLNRAGQSLAEGLRLAACQELDIEFTELVTGFRVRQNRNGDFVDIYLYDSLSSGAGYAVSIESSIRQLLTKTRELLEGCTCDSACHSCLKHYRNQYIHSVLDRKAALDLLNWGETGARVSVVPYEKQQYLLKSLEQILQISGIHIDVNHESVWAEGRYSKKKVVVYPAMWTKPIEENTIFVSDAHLKYAKPYALKTILDSL